MVGQLVGDELVPPSKLVAHQAQQDPVNGAEVVQVAGVVHLLVQLHVERNLPELLVASADAAFHQRVAKPERCRCESVCDGWVHGRIVTLVVTTRFQSQLKDLENSWPEYDWEPLVVCYVLHHCSDEPARLQESSVIRPVRVELAQFQSDPIVFPKKKVQIFICKRHM